MSEHTRLGPLAQEKEPISGIYIIECSANGKIYLGCSGNIRGRWHRHLSLLRQGKHHNQHLQAAWTMYGETRFHLRLLEPVAPDQALLFEREAAWSKILRPYDRERGFNASNSTRAFSKEKSYLVTPPNDKERLVRNLERFCLQNGLDKSSLHKVANGETRSYKGWVCRHAADSWEDWEKRRRRAKKPGTSPIPSVITYRDGATLEVPNLAVFARERGLSAGNLHNVASGRVKSAYGIVSIRRVACE